MGIDKCSHGVVAIVCSICLALLVVGTRSAHAAEKKGQDALAAASEAVDTGGVHLPYEVLRSDLKDTQRQGEHFEIRNGGFGSAMTGHPTVANRFYALTDRGPNATFKGAYGKGKIFPTPEYTPRIGLFELTPEGEVVMVETILLRRPDGAPISGLPNTSAFGGTGETPYHAYGWPILEDGTKPFNDDSQSPEHNPFRLDDFGLDGEGLVALSDGTFWVSDEYGPHMVHFDAKGVEIGRINPFSDDARCKVFLPAEFANRRANRGMEGLAVTTDETTLVGVMQSTMYNPDKKVKKLDITRIVTVNPESGEVKQYLYRQEKPQNSNSEIAALPDGGFLIIERDGAFLAKKPEAMKRVYRIDLASGTELESLGDGKSLVQDQQLGLLLDGKSLEQVVLEEGWEALEAAGITPVRKELVVDMAEAVNYPHDKMEGLWVMANGKLGVLNDDDFATWSTDGGLHQKMLDKDTVDGNTLYIVDMK